MLRPRIVQLSGMELVALILDHDKDTIPAWCYVCKSEYETYYNLEIQAIAAYPVNQANKAIRLHVTRDYTIMGKTPCPTCNTPWSNPFPRFAYETPFRPLGG